MSEGDESKIIDRYFPVPFAVVFIGERLFRPVVYSRHFGVLTLRDILYLIFAGLVLSLAILTFSPPLLLLSLLLALLGLYGVKAVPPELMLVHAILYAFRPKRRVVRVVEEEYPTVYTVRVGDGPAPVSFARPAPPGAVPGRDSVEVYVDGRLFEVVGLEEEGVVYVTLVPVARPPAEMTVSLAFKGQVYDTFKVRLVRGEGGGEEE